MSLSLTEPSPGAWDAFSEAAGGHLLQSARWGAHKSAFGWQMQIVGLERGGTLIGGALILYRRLPMRLGWLAYTPFGPVLPEAADQAAADFLLSGLIDAARRRGAALLKVAPFALEGDPLQTGLAQAGFKESPQAVQPLRTILIDLSGTEDDVLSRMSQSTRRKVRLPYRREVEFRRGGADDWSSYHSLMQATGTRDGFGVRPLAYYQTAFDLFGGDHACLLMASHAGQDIAGLMVFRWGKQAIYLYGASSDAHRDRMATYGLQWEAMRWAREKGCTTYDLWGIPDYPEAQLEAQFQARQDGLWGVYGFKRGFGGQVIRWAGAWDKPLNPAVYAAYRAALRLRPAHSEA